MNAPYDRLVKGWCPGALRPMLSGDGLVVRVRAYGGRLTQDQARGLADLASRYGNGLIDLSARANLQLRGIRDHAAVLTKLATLELIDGDEAIEGRRNILVTPFWQQGDGTQDLAAELMQALATSDLALPGKFGFALDSGETAVLRQASADIRIEKAGDRYLLQADGATLAAATTRHSAVTEALHLARWFLETGGARDGRGRMRDLLARGASLPPHFTLTAPYVTDEAPHPGLTPAGALVALPFGQTDSRTLSALADLAPLRLTPWRMLLLEGLNTMPDLPGLITTPADPLLRVTACNGAPGCAQALAPVRDLARQLAPSVPEGAMLHVSGCAKGCAHPSAADITLVARGRDFALGYGCTAKDTPDTPFTPAQLLADPTLLMTRS
ncbi:precorrin-3B synthase [Novosphingobium sp.]|uniref:precorrin-3B synthase n=1 Tax=Novosphingobium sp. TaxID=1874826 RepID=UPI0031E01C56